jgi:hypothetical protein
MGLKFGHDGLSYNWRIDTYQFKNIVLLKDYNQILPVLGYDPAIYNRGFDTLEDIFRFVVSSPFFNKAIFQLDNRNHAARIRDAKRKTYMSFLKWIECYVETIEQIENAKLHDSPEGKNVWLPYLFYNIPDFKETYDTVNEEWKRAIEYKKRFNGYIVREITGLDGKELGKFMKYFKDNENEIEQNFLLSSSEDLIKEWIHQVYNFYRITNGN